MGYRVKTVRVCVEKSHFQVNLLAFITVEILKAYMY